MSTPHRAILEAAYLSKALEALNLARQAAQEGRQKAHAGFVSEAIHWRAMSAACGSQEEVTHA